MKAILTKPVLGVVLLLLSNGTWSGDENAGDRTRPGRAMDTVVYTNVFLIDGTGAPLEKSVWIVVDGERISAILDMNKPLPAGAQIVDGTGWYAIPGLIDSHVHLATMPASDIARRHLRRQIYSGITLVRDMAGDTRNLADLSRAAQIDEIESPDIYYSALMAGPSFFTDPRTRTSALGVEPGNVPWMQAITKETDLTLAVAQAKGTWASGIKLYANLSGNLRRSLPALVRRTRITGQPGGPKSHGSPACGQYPRRGHPGPGTVDRHFGGRQTGQHHVPDREPAIRRRRPRVGGTDAETGSRFPPLGLPARTHSRRAFPANVVSSASCQALRVERFGG